MSALLCRQCCQPFAPKPKSKATYCSDRCRRDAKDEREAALLRASRAEIDLMLGNPSDDYDITYEVERYEGADQPPSLHKVTVQGWGAVPPAIRDRIIRHSPEAIPADILALAPGDPRRALQRHLGYDPGTYCGNKYPAMWPLGAFAGYPISNGGKPSPS